MQMAASYPGGGGGPAIYGVSRLRVPGSERHIPTHKFLKYPPPLPGPPIKKDCWDLEMVLP